MRKDTADSESSLNERRLIVPGELVFDCQLRAPVRGMPRELILLLHGYEESGRRLLTKLADALPEDAVVCAPNGPFPIPRPAEGGYRLGYSWYIYNPATREYVIDMRTALGFLEAAIAQLGYGALPKRVIGFSQGGYLAPIAAQRLAGVTQVIGLACEYLADELPDPVAFRIDGVHGEQDEIVPAAEARATHARLAARGIAGELIVLGGSGHRIDAEMRGAVKALLDRART